MIRDLARLRENYLTCASPTNSPTSTSLHLPSTNIHASIDNHTRDISSSALSYRLLTFFSSTKQPNENDWRRQVRWQGERFQERAIVSRSAFRQCRSASWSGIEFPTSGGHFEFRARAGVRIANSLQQPFFEGRSGFPCRPCPPSSPQGQLCPACWCRCSGIPGRCA